MIISFCTNFVWFVDLEFYEFIAFVSWVWNLLVWTLNHCLSLVATCTRWIFSQRLKWAFLITICLLSVVVVVVVNFSHFLLLLHNHWANFNQTSLGEGDSSFEGPDPFPRVDNYDIVKVHWRILENHWANFNQTWHKASLCEGD